MHNSDPENNIPPISTRWQHIGVVIWSSFLTAGAGTMFFFAMFDPVALNAVTTWSVVFSRMTGYTVGFFLFWVLTACASALTAYLLWPDKKIHHDR